MRTLFLLLFGAFFLGACWMAHRSGEFPAGHWGFQPYRPTRADQPVAFYGFMALYTVGGLACLGWGLASLFTA